MPNVRKIYVLLSVSVLLAACIQTETASTYSRQQMGRAASVQAGTIVSIRQVDVTGSNSGLGAGAGAAGGAVAGSYVGGDVRTNLLGAIGGAVVGGLAGSAAEGAATADKATEFLISLENGDRIAIVQQNDENLTAGEKVLLLKSDRIRVIRDPEQHD
jgi:outer membrane lipoprotein SlyB